MAIEGFTTGVKERIGVIKTKNIEYIDVRFKDILIKEKEGKDAR